MACLTSSLASVRLYPAVAYSKSFCFSRSTQSSGRQDCTGQYDCALRLKLRKDPQLGFKKLPDNSSTRHLSNVTCEAGTGTVSTSSGTEWVQRTIELPAFKRGCHIITQHIYRAVPEISQFRVGIVHLFVMHTSASLTINENASPDVPLDMEDTLNRIVPEGHQYRHLDEGFDDMPAHVKASMMGSSLTIPITSGRFSLGIWQGIWLNEHRNHGGSRSVCITIQGEKRTDGRVYK